MLRALGFGMAILLLANGTVILLAPALVQSAVTYWLGAGAMYCASVASAYVTSRMATRLPWPSGLLMAIPAAALWVAYNLAASVNGVGTDLGGRQGNIIFGALALGWNALLCALGAELGVRLRPRPAVR